MVLGSSICLLVWFTSIGGIWTQKFEAKVGYCCVWRREETRRVHFARPRPQASEPALTASLVVKRRAEALHAIFLNQSIWAQHDDWLLLAAYSRMIRSHERRAECAALLGLYVPARAARQQLWSARGEARRLRSRTVVVFVIQRIDTRTAAVYPRLCSVRILVDWRPMPFFDFISDGPSRQMLAQNLTTWATGFSNQILSRRILHCRTAQVRSIIFSHRKKKTTTSSESDRIRISLKKRKK